jgi:SAM-dependent methyltransferase
MPNDYIQKVQHHFSALIKKYGDSVRAVDWGGEEQQRLRFEVLASAWPTLDCSVLDVGCGRGDFYDFLKSRGFRGEYLGVDITEEMVSLSQKRFPEPSFEIRDLLVAPLPRQFDFVVASGIFYIHQENHLDYSRGLIRALFNHADKALAFNMLSALTKNQESHESYFIPSEVVSFCQTLTPYVSLRHEYKQNDFTVYMYKQPHFNKAT